MGSNVEDRLYEFVESVNNHVMKSASVAETPFYAKFKVLEGRWNIEREAIGEGGFGTVHLCKSLKSGKQRACKAMRLPSTLDREDFRHEVAILKAIKTHFNIKDEV